MVFESLKVVWVNVFGEINTFGQSIELLHTWDINEMGSFYPPK
jgi:hypothetical protein